MYNSTLLITVEVQYVFSSPIKYDLIVLI